MAIEFFDTNKGMVNELKWMNHNSKDSKKLLKKVFVEMGGLPILLGHLKETPEGNRYRKKYYASIAVTSIMAVLMFALIFAAAVLTKGNTNSELSDSQAIFVILFICAELFSLSMMLFFAFRAQKYIYAGLSYAIYTYQIDNTQTYENTIANYPFKRAKANKKMLIITFIATFIVVSLQLFNYGVFDKLFSSQEKTFSKAGMTITLTKDFAEKDNISQTATYISKQYAVVALKEEFSVLSKLNISSDISLKEYAGLIIANNGLKATVQEQDGIIYYKYNQQLNGKDITSFSTVYKANDAFWVITFACETKNFESTQPQFINWAKTIKV